MRPIKRVMLIYPPVTFSPQSMKHAHPPLGLAYLAAAVRKWAPGVELEVLDAAVEGHELEEDAGNGLLRYGLPFAEIGRRIKEFKPDLIGASCIFSSQFRNVIEVMKQAKAIDPGITTITGGTHPSFLPEICLERCPDLDLIGRGEGEFILLDVIKASTGALAKADILDLAWRQGSEIKLNPPRKPFENLDDLPFPARDLFPLEKYDRIGQPMGIVHRRRPFMNLITSRGCPFRCTFCSSTQFWKVKYRKRSAENVLAEMEHLYHDLGVREFKFFDDNLTTDPKRAKAIFRGMIDRQIKVSWNTPNGIHAMSLDDEMLDLIKASGGYELTLAVESGNEKVLRDIIKKPTSLAQVVKIAAMMRKKGIGSFGFFIIGFPGETREQMNETLEFSRKLDLDRADFFIFNPLPGTKLFQECLDRNYIKPTAMTEDVDYFEPRFDTEEWTREEITAIRKRWFWRYNLGLLLRHPIRFFKRYWIFVTRPGLTLEVFRRMLRG